MRYMYLLQKLFNAFIDWFGEWKPTFDREREEAKAKADKASGKVVDVNYTDVTPGAK